MKIDHCLILSAGLGTRMGEIGKRLPKVLWPVFQKTMLELQVRYAKKLGAANVYVNVHHLHGSIIKFVNDKQLDVTVLYEEELLDVGGAIYNLASKKEVNHQGTLLILNGDQFLFFDECIVEKALEECKKVGAALLAIQVSPNSGYNETVIEDGRLVGINRGVKKEHPYETYSGMSLIDLSKLEKRSGVQSFFSSVADYETKKVAMLDAGSYEYWDFGTIDRYWDSSFRLLGSKDSLFYNFCLECGAIDGTTLKIQNGIDLGRGGHSGDQKFIIMDSNEKIEVDRPGIYWNDLFIEVKQPS